MKTPSVALVAWFALTLPLFAQDADTPKEAKEIKPAPVERASDPIIDKIRVEGLNHSQVMKTLSYLTDVIGPRLTGSPNLKRANEWTSEKLTEWGLVNAHLEPWGPFGRGWSMKRFSAQVIEPQAFPVHSYPKAWSPGLPQTLTAPVVHLDIKTEDDFENYKGKLKGAIVMASPTREIKARFEPLAERMSDTNLAMMASGQRARGGPRQGGGAAFQRTGASTNATSPAPRTGGGPGGRAGGINPQLAARVLPFLIKEGAALLLSPTRMGDGGFFVVEQVSLPTASTGGRGGPQSSSRAWATNAAPTLPQLTVANEDYNRLGRMIQQGEKITMAVELQTQFHDEDLMAYNTIAEIPGTDLKDELVMVGAHMDSWHSGTGATDNGAGVAAAMEAVRILKALNLEPRRTIRIALWTGEEQGLYGSKAYVTKHFGKMVPITNSTATATATNSTVVGTNTTTTTNTAAARPNPNRNRPNSKLVREAGYEKLSAYYNLDNGTGKIRGIYLQGNTATRSIFKPWLAPFVDLGAETITASNTGGTDHESFDAIGLPGFQFIQDPIDYWTRTHHTSADVYDRIQADDMKQAATIMAVFLYKTAMMDEKLPRKSTQ